MLSVVGIGIGDARKQILIAFARQQISIGQRFLAEFGQVIVTRGISLHIEAAGIHGLAVRSSGALGGFSDSASQRFASFRSDQLFAAFVALFHGHSFLIFFGLPRDFAGIGVGQHFTRHIIARFEFHLWPRFEFPESVAGPF